MSEIVLKRREPLGVVRYVLETLERQSVKAGSHPLLIHQALEALESAERDAQAQRERADRLADGSRSDTVMLQGNVEEMDRLKQRIGTLEAALNRVLTEAGLQAHKHGCLNRLARPARWDEFAPCAGCQGVAALAAQPAQEQDTSATDHPQRDGATGLLVWSLAARPAQEKEEPL